MKKLISLMLSFSITSSLAANVVACGTNFNVKISSDVSYYTLSVGNGLFSYLQVENKAILFDAGVGLQDGASWTGELQKGNQFQSDFMKSTGVEEIEAIFITHNHSDHYGNLDAITKNFKVNNIVMPYNYSSLQKRFVNDKEKSNIGDSKIFVDQNTNIVEEYKKSYQYLGIKFENWSYTAKEYMKSTLSNESDENNRSSILYASINDHALLITGDAEENIGKEVMKNRDLRKVETLQVPHHGSGNMLSANFVKNLDPTYCYVSGTNAKNSEWKDYANSLQFPTYSGYTKIRTCNEIYLTGTYLDDSGYSDDFTDEFDQFEGSFEYQIKTDGSTALNYYEQTIINPIFE
ncbi:MBL fold metallo-hydrolase [Spiroplasma culicicola]|uniref:DNA internalization-related competence protein ComEC/Rec2 n=1 Tax=Spiroplasma culicicola AES-1 TaxID=1276246 RepID=W6A7D8_9MOLU|nr:MBL fold metallo-hydrolase [Spiroplasma culicicola]AHI52902.1 DNA internalization-related competence protein ComEC/Rec2 [Spiroplasma culicicola AES-1]